MKPYYYVYRVGIRISIVQHATPAEAIAEAERLAAQSPGDTFEVLQCLAVTRTTTPVTEWLDGCGPEEPVMPTPPEPGYIEITDPTRRVVPIPGEYLPLPPLPESKTQWVGRGTFPHHDEPVDGRIVEYWFLNNWNRAKTFSDDLFHIEAV